ncbi:MAG TPA: ribosomal protein S18-alanine N-acetyltransferase [Gemmatimonadales bacterium]|nr:ribosomal protein S18-alanine N-acetyltransferase [Gemmatimonadales bacterium]
MVVPPKRRPSGSASTDTDCRIRPARPADVAALAALEQRCFSDPWSEASFRESVEGGWSFGLVAETDDGVAGYLIAREAAGTGEILNLAVAPEARRGGIAWRLLQAGLATLATRRVEEVFLEVRASNLAAQALYRRAGFRPVGQRAAYYRSPREDALVLRREVTAG